MSAPRRVVAVLLALGLALAACGEPSPPARAPESVDEAVDPLGPEAIGTRALEIEALGLKAPTIEVVEELRHAAQDERDEIRLIAIRTLGIQMPRLGDRLRPRALASLAGGLHDPREAVRFEAAAAMIAHIRARDDVDALMLLAERLPEAPTRAQMVTLQMIRMLGPHARPAEAHLAAFAQEATAEVSIEAALAHFAATGEADVAWDAISRAFGHESPTVRRLAVDAARSLALPPGRLAGAFRVLLVDRDPGVRDYAAVGLIEAGVDHEAARRRVEEIAADEEDPLAADAQRALDALGDG